MSNPDPSDAAMSVKPLDDRLSGGAELQGSEGSVLVSDLFRRSLLYQEELCGQRHLCSCSFHQNT